MQHRQKSPLRTVVLYESGVSAMNEAINKAIFSASSYPCGPEPTS